MNPMVDGWNRDEHFMREALKEAALAFAEGEVPIGAVLVHEDRIIARAHNQVERLQDPSAHAEMLAITAGCQTLGAKYLQGCRLYVTIEPCPMCAGAIRWAKLSSIVYGASEDKFGYRVFSPDITPKSCQIRGGVLEAEARELMQTFFRSRR